METSGALSVMQQIPGNGIEIELDDSGLLSTDRITAKDVIQVNGLKPGVGYEYSINNGQSWVRVAAPLQSSAAIRFDGQNDHITIPDNLSLPSGNNSYTLEAWIKPEVMGDRGILGWGTWGTQSSVNALRLMGNGSIRHYWWSNDLDVNVGNLADGNWHHVAATFDGTTRSVYVDGILKGSDVPRPHKVPVRAKNVRIGSTNNGEYFQGSIDDVAIWNRALTQSELVQRQIMPPNPADKDLALFYEFSESGGSSVAATGSASYELSGSLVNGPTWTTRELAAAQIQGPTSLQLQLADGKYLDDQFIFREQNSQAEFRVPAFTIDTIAPNIRLNQPGGRDAVISSQAGDNVISGKAEPGHIITLMSRLGSVTSGNLRITSDNAADIYLNGKFIASTNDWTKPFDFTGLNIQAGANTLAILAYDVGGIAGLSGRFNVPAGAFGTSDLANWKVLNVDPEPLSDNSTASRDKSLWKLPANWTTTNFDDSSWSAPVDVRAKTGQYPWGNITGDPAWIWSADPYNHDAVLFRYTFAGTTSDEGLQSVVENIEISAEDGSFSYALTTDQIRLFGQGQGKSIVAMQKDLAGNAGRSSELLFSVDTEAGPVKITSVGGTDGRVSNDLVEIGQGPLNFNLDQYTGYWSSKLSDLQTYVNKYNPAVQKNRYSAVTSVIDYTDDPFGFAGELPFDLRWPAAEATNYRGKGGINDRFFVKISTDFYVNDASKYRFRTFNDDGVFLLIDNKLVINDPTLHPERIFTGDIDLQPGNHNLELFFFENGGEASLELSVSRFDSVKNSWGAYQMVGKDPAIKSKSEKITDNVITGEADPNASVTISIDGRILGSTFSDPDGKFIYSLSDQDFSLIAASASSEGLIAMVSDPVGNISASLPSPVAVSDPIPEVRIVTIGGADSQLTSKASDRSIEGVGTADLITAVYFGDIKLGQVVANDKGSFFYDLSDALALIGQGTGKQVWAEQVTPSGVKGHSPKISFSVDTIAPVVNIDNVGLGNGRVSRSGNLIEGRAEAGGSIMLYSGSTLIGTSAVNDQGRFVHPLSSNALSLIAENPAIGLTVYQTDSAGNKGEFLISPITTKLTAPAFSSLSIGGDDTVVSSLSGDAQISGTAEANFPVSFSFNGKLLEAAAIADQAGAFTAVLSSADIGTIGQGLSRILTLQQVDDYGNVGQAVTAPFSVDTLAPQLIIPSIGDISALGGKDGVISTQVNDALILGKAEPGDLFIKYGINILSTLSIGRDGLFSYSLTTQDISRIGQGGDKFLSLEQSDLAGNLGVAQIPFAVDTLPPSSPTIASVALDSVVSGKPSDNQILGNAEPNSNVTLFVNNRPIGVTKASGDGSFQYRFTPSELLDIGQGNAQLVAQISDEAGNLARSEPFSFRVDTVAPLRPELQSIGGDDSVVSTKGSGAVTETVDNMVQGRAEANALVQFFSGTRLLGQSQASDQGLFSYSLSSPNLAALGQGVGRKLQVVAVDVAGNASIASDSFIFDIDTIAPTTPRVSSVGGSDGVISTVLGDNFISGTAEPFSQLDLRAFSSSIVSSNPNVSDLFSVQLMADKSGKWTHSFSDNQISVLESPDSFSLMASSIDSAGNRSTSIPLSVKVDRVAPLLGLSPIGGADSTISTKPGDNVISGTAEPNRSLSISFQGQKLADIKSKRDGTFSYMLSVNNLRTLGEGYDRQVQINQSDAAGNASELLSLPFDIDITAPGKTAIRSLGGSDKIVSSAQADRVVMGTGDPGVTVELLAIAGATRTPLGVQTVAADGSFAYTLSPENLRAIGRGVGKSIVASSSDAAGNVSTSAEFSFQVQANWSVGNAAADKLAFASGLDALTGQGGSDTFMIRSLGTVLMDQGINPAFDRITDFEIGVDRIDAPTVVSVGLIRDLGEVNGLVASSIGNMLSAIAFPAYSAAVFSYDDRVFGARTFLAINDGVAGFRPQNDGILEITGYSGNIAELGII